MTTYLPVTLTQAQRDNLAILADVLASEERRRALAPHYGFAMQSFQQDYEDPETHECGTVACAAGWGPLAGIPRLNVGTIGVRPEDWRDYCARAFGAGHFDWYLQRYLFSGDWAHIDQTPESAATRIRTVLAHGIPKDWDESDEWQFTDFSANELEPVFLPL